MSKLPEVEFTTHTPEELGVATSGVFAVARDKESNIWCYGFGRSNLEAMANAQSYLLKKLAKAGLAVPVGE